MQVREVRKGYEERMTQLHRESFWASELMTPDARDVFAKSRDETSSVSKTQKHLRAEKFVKKVMYKMWSMNKWFEFQLSCVSQKSLLSPHDAF